MRKENIFIVVIGLLILGVILFFTNGNIHRTSGAGEAWYAVNLNNNQVFFGHITDVNDSTITLTDARFIEIYQEPAPIATSKNFVVEQAPKQTFRVVRRGDDNIFSSDHKLFINREAVLFWEKLTPESEIMKLIEGEK